MKTTLMNCVRGDVFRYGNSVYLVGVQHKVTTHILYINLTCGKVHSICHFPHRQGTQVTKLSKIKVSELT